VQFRGGDGGEDVGGREARERAPSAPLLERDHAVELA
jgi:hypothetical protein